MLAYAARVAEGYRPPHPPFWPKEVRQLVSACCAQEPHERPRMGEVLEVLKALARDEAVVGALNSYVHEDVGFVPQWAQLEASQGAAPGEAAAAAAAATQAGEGQQVEGAGAGAGVVAVRGVEGAVVVRQPCGCVVS